MSTTHHRKGVRARNRGKMRAGSKGNAKAGEKALFARCLNTLTVVPLCQRCLHAASSKSARSV
ncbi:MAG: hypothetical protein E6Q99_05060 [Elusimicrobia bacterium]|nr:MAG: hypothetical protein E6Q99_05060 [Elusimicrobiota bacterium]